MQAPDNRRMNDETEAILARVLATMALQQAGMLCLPCDAQAGAVALLVRALEIAAPDLSPAGRARLFHEVG